MLLFIQLVYLAAILLGIMVALATIGWTLVALGALVRYPIYGIYRVIAWAVAPDPPPEEPQRPHPSSRVQSNCTIQK
jgi:hypothetical protein